MATKPKVTSSRIRQALNSRYGQNRTEEWIIIEEARSGAGFAGNTGQCDYLAINAWKSKGHQIVGHEIKVSKADWRRELDNPQKSERFSRYCNRWWLAMPADLARQVEPEVPLSWGILAVTEKTCRQMRAAPLNENVETVPLSWWVGWMASLSRQNSRNIQRQAALLAATQVAEAYENADRRTARHVADVEARYSRLQERLDNFEQATGMNVEELSHPYRLQRLEAALKLADAAGNGNGLERITQAKDVIDALHEMLAKIER